MRCVCGQELVVEGLHACPACGAIVDPTGVAEEGIEVEGRRLPIRVWEGEIALRGVAWVAGLHAASMFSALSIAYLLLLLRIREQYRALCVIVISIALSVFTLWMLSCRPSLCARLMGVAVGGGAILCLFLWQGALHVQLGPFLGFLAAWLTSIALLSRLRVVAVGLALFSVGWLVYVGRLLLTLGVGWNLGSMLLVVCLLPPLFCCGALVSPQGRMAFRGEYHGQPLAHFASLRQCPWNPIGWATVGAVALSWLLAAALIALGLGWID